MKASQTAAFFIHCSTNFAKFSHRFATFPQKEEKTACFAPF
jgi:hypothetical protein